MFNGRKSGKWPIMAQPGTDGNVLTTLDDRMPTAFYWKLTLLATLGGFLFGYDTSNIGSALNFVPYHLHGLRRGLPGGRGLAGRGRGRDPRRAADRPVRPQDAADRRRGHLRGRRDPVRGDPGRRGAAGRAHDDRRWRSARTRRSRPPTSPSTRRRTGAGRWPCCSSG